MSPSRELPIALVLEDEPRYRTFLAGVLREMECRPVLAATADEAMRHIRETPPDMLFLDLNLPVTDGLTFLEQFRKVCPIAPVVIITGFGDLASARQAIRLGVTDFLSKPCDLGQIELAIDRARKLAARTSTPSAPPVATAIAEDDPIRSLAAIEREAILDALRRCEGNRSAAARLLGLSRRTLYNKIAEYQRDGHDVP
jgi:DNA-binding NtrC family response regulator